ncbi:hypothetical protein P7K49_013973 [Saguinus oedipus]|uniref:Uncharacterized protein n=1 Tax=Saguinus oedipus TaxID=9490 RepID=A0ABQ9VHI8_SAGOE|nr:hypothetical protein P7K49_013973 [Saguinus oedipus]
MKHEFYKPTLIALAAATTTGCCIMSSSVFFPTTGMEYDDNVMVNPKQWYRKKVGQTQSGG